MCDLQKSIQSHLYYAPGIGFARSLGMKKVEDNESLLETTHDKDNGFRKIVQDHHHESLKLQKGKLCIGSGHDNVIIRKLATVLPITSLQLISIHWYGHRSIVTCK